MTSGRQWRWDQGSGTSRSQKGSEGQESLKPQLQPRAASPDLREPQLPCPSSRNHTVLTHPTSQVYQVKRVECSQTWGLDHTPNKREVRGKQHG